MNAVFYPLSIGAGFMDGRSIKVQNSLPAGYALFRCKKCDIKRCCAFFYVFW